MKHRIIPSSQNLQKRQAANKIESSEVSASVFIPPRLAPDVYSNVDRVEVNQLLEAYGVHILHAIVVTTAFHVVAFSPVLRPKPRSVLGAAVRLPFAGNFHPEVRFGKAVTLVLGAQPIVQPPLRCTGGGSSGR